MPTHTARGDSFLALWRRVREFAVPPSMIETATARRTAGDWAGACAAAGVNVDVRLRTVERSHGTDVAARLRADLRHLAPDLLRWHLPRIAPDGLLRPGLTLALARYDAGAHHGRRPLHLVVRTPPAWAAAGQRIALGVWDGDRTDAGAHRHPHPRPHRRHRLDLHRHLWDARRSEELPSRCGADRPPGAAAQVPYGPDLAELVPDGYPCAVDRWAAEAGLVLDAEGRTAGTVVVRLGARHRLALDLVRDDDPGWGADGGGARPDGASRWRIAAASARVGRSSALPTLPDAATWTLPDLQLLRAGLLTVDSLHPLVASALGPVARIGLDQRAESGVVDLKAEDGGTSRAEGPGGAAPGHASPARSVRQALAPGRASTGPPTVQDPPGGTYHVDCRGARHRIALVDGVLAPLDHGPDEIRREELLIALTGTPLPCLQAIDEAHRRPDCLPGVRERLDHGDFAGAFAVVEALLGPDAVLRNGPLRDALEGAAGRRIAHGLYRADLTGSAPRPERQPRQHRARPRHATLR
ncbi:hypothetical protein ACH41E_24035 [Streptomyces sp. NPDC020412]|uniref:hypothetical protein n=1 Tax=Streptomyces sp. NPDC020412 TaxID=3365073 RepID=UPI0037B27E7C